MCQKAQINPLTRTGFGTPDTNSLVSYPAHRSGLEKRDFLVHDFVYSRAGVFIRVWDSLPTRNRRVTVISGRFGREKANRTPLGRITFRRWPQRIFAPTPALRWKCSAFLPLIFA